MEILNLAGGNASRYCRSCQSVRLNFFEISEFRNYNDHLEILEDLDTSEITKTDAMESFGIKRIHYLNLSQFDYFEPFLDIPFDILHSVYLGLIKHALTAAAELMNIVEKLRFQKYFSQLNTSGIFYLPRGNILKNIKSLIGKDFKFVSQVVSICLENSLVDTHL